MTVLDMQISAELDLRAKLHACADAGMRAIHLMLKATDYLNKGDADAARALLPVIRAEIEKAQP